MPLGSRGMQALGRRGIATVETGVEPELLNGIATLVGAARDADDARNLELGVSA